MLNFNTFPNEWDIIKLMKNIESDDICEDGKAVGHSVSETLINMLTIKNFTRVQECIGQNPLESWQRRQKLVISVFCSTHSD